jgi:hypothetical protein
MIAVYLVSREMTIGPLVTHHKKRRMHDYPVNPK